MAKMCHLYSSKAEPDVNSRGFHKLDEIGKMSILASEALLRENKKASDKMCYLGDL